MFIVYAHQVCKSFAFALTCLPSKDMPIPSTKHLSQDDRLPGRLFLNFKGPISPMLTCWERHKTRQTALNCISGGWQLFTVQKKTLQNQCSTKIAATFLAVFWDQQVILNHAGHIAPQCTCFSFNNSGTTRNIHFLWLVKRGVALRWADVSTQQLLS